MGKLEKHRRSLNHDIINNMSNTNLSSKIAPLDRAYSISLESMICTVSVQSYTVFSYRITGIAADGDFDT